MNYNCPRALNAQNRLISWPFNSLHLHQTKDLHKSETNTTAKLN